MGESMMKCSCKTYEVVQKAVLHQQSLLPGEEAILAENMTCMHCRFFKDKLVGSFEVIVVGREMPYLYQKIMDGQGNVEEAVYLLGSVVSSGATKFSVRGNPDEEVSYSIVNVSFRQKQCFFRCMDGSCSAQARNKKKIPKHIPLSDSKKHCVHLNTMLLHLDHVKVHFPHYFQEEDEEEEDDDNTPTLQEERNQEDANIANHLKRSFNVETGLWNYPAVSCHIPSDKDCPEAIR
jgi:hypothetical protein